jgi:anti-anti-sigma factor
MIANAHKVKRALLDRIDSIEIAGPFDFNDPTIDSIATQVLEEGKQCIAFDLSRVSYITSPGLSSVVKVLKKIQAINGLLYIKGATPDMVDLFRLAAVDKFIRFM